MHGPIVHYRAYRCYGAREENLKNPDYLKNFLYKIAELCKTKPADFFYKQFEGGGEGVTAILVVEESFIIVETWPEYEHFYVIARVCGPNVEIKGMDTAIKEFFPEVKEIKPFSEQEIKK